MSECFADLLKEYELNINEGDIVEATVVEVKRDYIHLDLGFKNICMIPRSEFMDFNNPVEINVGDKVEVMVEELEDGYGSSILSREKAKEVVTWKKIRNAIKENTSLKAYVVNSVRGGLIVEVDKVQGFLPSSLVDITPVKNLSSFERQLIDVKIVKVDEEKRTILVSRKATIQPETFNPEEVMNSLYVGKIVDGTIKNITEYGAFVDLGGVDGLLHITDISWTRIESPKQHLKLGQKLKLKVTRCDHKNKKISLSLKELDMTPWNDIVKNYKENDTIKGKISKINDYGVFVSLETGIEGLVFNNEIDWNDKGQNASKNLNEGDFVEAKIIEIDDSKYRISLSLKRMLDNPWNLFKKEHSVGDTVEGVIKNITDFGLFVDINSGVSGVIPTDMISWSPLKKDYENMYSIGDTITAVIKKIDSEKEKVMFSIRDNSPNPYLSYENNVKLGDVVEGKVVDISLKTITVSLDDGVYGLIRQVDTGFGEEPLDNFFEINDIIKAKIINMSNTNNNYIRLSIKDSLDSLNVKNDVMKQALKNIK